jgi:hypothetical protein
MAHHCHSRSEEKAYGCLMLLSFEVEGSGDILQATYRILKIGVKRNITFDNIEINWKIPEKVQLAPAIANRKVILKQGVVSQCGEK